MDRLSEASLLAGEWPVMGLRLMLALMLGAVIGLEREQRERPAGLRTHVLVCVSACLVMMIGLLLAEEGSNAGRVVQGVMTGVGFLGAGTIIRQGNVVRGLTTAATIWAAAAIGLAVGLGWYEAALLGTVLVVLTLTVLHLLEARLHGSNRRIRLEVQVRPECPLPSGLLTVLTEHGVGLRRLEAIPAAEGEDCTIQLWLEPGETFGPGAVQAMLRSVAGVREVRLMDKAPGQAEDKSL